ncbi:efflux RND transporter periplasmic adaptor subunit, partial [Oscillospiraceae bacterium OttesenSCG-928-G22]|nr:efflux RND transporter periplasmic adaptor subunit [Oscillospiraceae bacterium OttesenSCG-928-G22]
VVIAISLVSVFGRGPRVPTVETLSLSRLDLERTVAVSGMVESVHTKNVYSPLSYLVQEIYVEEGDMVEEGDLLCRLDVSALEKDYESQLANTNYQKTTGQIDAETRRRAYETALYNYNNDLTPELIQAKATAENAQTEFEQRQKALDDAKLLYELGELSQKDLESAQTAFDVAERSRNQANTALEATDSALRQSIRSLNDAYRASVANLQNDSPDILLSKLEQTLADAQITAPVSGVVTASYATVGAPPQGILFIIEDPGELKIEATVGEYDVSDVAVGQSCVIKAGALDNVPIEGVVSRVAVTARKGAGGTVQSTGDVQFDVELRVSEKDSGLLVGMNARASILIERTQNVFAVTYDMLYIDENGDAFVFAAQSDGDGKYTVTSIPVTQGVESDFYIEIAGGGLSEGMLLIRSPELVSPGDTVLLASEAAQ